MANMLKEMFGTKASVELTPDIEKMIDQSKFLIRVVKQQMRNTGIYGTLSYHGQMDDNISQLNRDIELLKKGKVTQKNIDALANHNLALRTCAENLMENFEEEYAIQYSLREKYIKEREVRERKDTEAQSPAAIRMVEADADEWTVWEKLYEAAASVRSEREISESVYGGQVAAAVLSDSGKIYTGICIDAPCALGICAERNALFHMLTEGEKEFTKLLVIRSDGSLGIPCGACREFMTQLIPDTYKEVQILLDYEEKKWGMLSSLH